MHQRAGPAPACRRGRRRAWTALLAPLVWLAGCGGQDTDPPAGAAPPQRLQPLARDGGLQALGNGLSRALRERRPMADGRAVTLQPHAAAAGSPLLAPVVAAAGSVDPLDAAQQLMDFGEAGFPQYFPSRRITRHAGEWLYRFYPETGVYLGVRFGVVHVLGGPFGGEPLAVGLLTDFITPRAPAAQGACSTDTAAHGLFATPAPAVGRNAAVALLGCTTTITRAQWRQTRGEPVTFVADRSQAISFDPPAAGVYGFQVEFTDAQGVARRDAVTLQVADGALPDTRVTVRAAHAVRMGGKASLRAWVRLAPGDAIDHIRWEQVEGPPVLLDTRERELAVFTAPAVVERDTVIRLRATVTTRQGAVEHDEATVLVERFLQARDGDAYAAWAGEHIPRLYPYVADGPHARHLLRCTYDPGQRDWGPDHNLCPLSELPFLGQATGDIPTVEQVMQRVAVSHDWLGRNFETFLRLHDERGDFRRMLRSVTAIILSTHIRPSFYFAGTGAIYLDADDFWLTPEERDSVNEAADFRSDFGSELQFRTLWRYVQGNRPLSGWADPEPRQVQPASRLRDAAGWLLYHELAHALDFLPPSAYGTLQNAGSVWDNLYPRTNARLLASDTVTDEYRLRSAELHRLGQVQFQGVQATAIERAYTPDQVSAWFAADLAVDDYSYSTTREDLAMTVEAFLMSHRQGVQRDIAFLPLPHDGDSPWAAAVTWGQRGRIGEPSLQPRLRGFLRQVVPWVDLAEVDRLPPPLPMRAGDTWANNLDLSPTALAAPATGTRKRLLGAPPTASERARERYEQRRMRHPLHLQARPLPVAPGATGLTTAQQVRRGVVDHARR